MEVILQEKVANLGDLGDIVKVKPGYGRNYLIPGGKAVMATPENKAQVEARRAELEKAAAGALAKAQQRLSTLDGCAVTIRSRVGEGGRLFGSVGTAEIAAAFTESGTPVAKNEVRMPTGVLREVGEHEIELHLHTDLNAHVKVIIEPEE
jgi:large subunit ribosomal protein L9